MIQSPKLPCDGTMTASSANPASLDPMTATNRREVRHD